MRIEKAIEISDAKIQFVSLVDKAANQRQFLITKADNGQAQFASLGKILKVDNDTHYVTGIVYEPLVEDSHGNFMTAEEIRKAAHWFAKNGDKVDLQHSFEPVSGVTVVETYVAPCDMTVGETTVIKGTWLMTVEIDNADVWEKVQKGEVTGFSMGGVGKYSENDVELAEVAASERKGIFKKMAGLFGLDVVEKGEVKDKYKRTAMSNNFWAAWNALESVLQYYNWNTDRWEFETDEATVREALSDFTEIITALLTEDNIIKALEAQKPVTKAGKKISTKNYSELQKIYDDIGALLTVLSDGEKEDNEVTKQEIQSMIDEAVKKAAAPAAAAEPATEEPATLTAETVQSMIDEAVKKAVDSGVEAAGTGLLTAETVQGMITKSLEPILKARGIPSNLSGEGDVAKSEDTHYLTGIL